MKPVTPTIVTRKVYMVPSPTNEERKHTVPISAVAVIAYTGTLLLLNFANEIYFWTFGRFAPTA